MTTSVTADFRGSFEHLQSIDRAIRRSQAVIEFDLSGTIRDANENFLNVMGYRWDELQGQHHRMFVEDSYARSHEYQSFWQRLRTGEFFSGTFQRIGKGGRTVWIRASYNPLINEQREVTGVIKFAVDITEEVEARNRMIDVIDVLAQAAGLLESASRSMQSNVTEASSRAAAVTDASGQVSTHLNTVATSAEEMSASIREISRSASQSAQIASQAVKVAATASGLMEKLGDSSAEIGGVVKVITSIAQQTNLLALNATIEAARAGASGKGFAVVANEVKELAKQTARATEDIGRRIESIQIDTRNAVQSIVEIGSIIDQINNFSTTIASAVEEQAATTNEINRSVAEAAQSGNAIARNLESVAQSTSAAAKEAESTKVSAAQLTGQALELQGIAAQFKRK